MSLVGFDQMYFAAVINEHFTRENIKHIQIFNENYGKIEISEFVIFTKHLTTIGFGSSRVNDIVVTLQIKPGILYLDFY